MNRLECIFAVCFALLLSSATTAAADLYRCVGPDGGLVFTNDASTCPGAPRHESPAAIQRHRTETPPSAPADSTALQSTPKPPHTDGRSAMKKHWQAKKRAKEDELRMLRERSEYLSRFVTGCNRNAQIITRDETGIKREVSCDEIRAEYEQSLERQRPIREYLENGLRQECRKAGCLPGWIR